ncbi:hypothetical protein UJ101_00512 [Flavobacteriaceae bacterium UJ101]|nr:hypothetical protein UJ101_00512 [Flavobacteriaceae bacterium UJ101]
MESYVVLLRGINVGGKRKILMKDLKHVLEENGFLDIQTYIQSGNIVLKSNFLLKSELINQIETYIERAFGFEVSVFVYTEQDWNYIIEQNPFQKDDITKQYCTFFNDEIDQSIVVKVVKEKKENDRLSVSKNSIYLYVEKGYSKTKLNNTFFEKQLNQKATTRNGKTIMKLQEMLQNL